MNKLDYMEYRKKLSGCYTGKAVGGTLGMPMEGFIGTKEVSYYDPVPTAMLANDDLDLQVMWLEVIRRFGLPVNRRLLADGFVEHLRAFPDEYGVVFHNMKRGLYPPLSGWYGNKFYAGMGAAIRAEIWACLAPGDPYLAVKLAREDACIDHCGDGVEASAFIAAAESMAFTESDRFKLIETGLSFLEPDGRIYKMLTSVMKWHKELRDPLEIRELILKTFFSQNWTDVGINLSFIVLSWLASGGDISKGLCIAAGLGHDADCTCATLGSIMGIIDPDGFEERWTSPLGNDLVLSSCLSAMHEADSVDEFCSQIAEICSGLLEYYGSETRLINIPADKIKFTDTWAKSDNLLSLDKKYEKRESLVAVNPLTVKLIYPEHIAMSPGESAAYSAVASNPSISLKSFKNCAAKIKLKVSDGWSVKPDIFTVDIANGREERIEFTVTAPAQSQSQSKRRRARNYLDFNISVDNSVEYCCSAGLVQTIEFLRKQINDEITGEICPSQNLFAGSEIVSARGYFQPVPESGSYLYAVDVRSSAYIPQAVFIAQGTRPLKVWYDDKLILDHDGCEYVPAFHRSDYIAVISLDGEWRRLTVLASEKNKKFDKNPGGALVKVPGAMSAFELRDKYDSDNLYGNEPGELFIGFVNRTGSQWIDDLEWRLPVI